MREIDKTYNIYDGTIGIWREVPSARKPFSLAEFIAREDERLRDGVFEQCREAYDEIRIMMMSDGFSFHMNPEIKKRYRLIAPDHHAGNRRDVYFLSSISGRHIEFKFFENKIRDNQYGGQYTSEKMEKMPYMTRLGVHRILNKIVAGLRSQGYVETSRTYPEDGFAAIMKHRQELEDFQGKGFYQRERSPYNCTDADGIEMQDGDLRYFWHYTGYLRRGVVYRNINNMWWVHTGPFSYWNVANFDLFTWKPEMGVRQLRSADWIAKRLAKELDKSVNEQNFERAIVLRDLTKRSVAS